MPYHIRLIKSLSCCIEVAKLESITKIASKYNGSATVDVDPLEKAKRIPRLDTGHTVFKGTSQAQAHPNKHFYSLCFL